MDTHTHTCASPNKQINLCARRYLMSNQERQGYQKDKELLERVQQTAVKMTRRMERCFSLMRIAWESWACLKKRQLRGDLINAHNYLQGRCHEDGARLSSVVPNDGTRGNRHKLKHNKFWIWGKMALLWGWKSNGTDCSEQLRSLLPRKYSKPA